VRRLFFAILFTTVAAFAVAAQPIVIIATQRAAVVDDVDPNVDIAGYFATHIEDLGMVHPVLWSPSDETFRSWQDSKLAPGGNSDAKLEQMLDVARKVNAKYVMLVSAFKSNGSVQGSVLAYDSRGKVAWRHADNMAVEVGGLVDMGSSAESIARTWSLLLRDSLFRGLPVRTGSAIDKPQPAPPQPQPDPTPTPAPQAMPRADEQAILAKAARLFSQGQNGEAIIVLREGTDQLPYSGALREQLVKVLVAAGLTELAADEATRFGRMNSQTPDLLVSSAKMWIDIGRIDRAQDALNEAKARDGENVSVIATQATIDLMNGDLARSQAGFAAALASKKTSDSAIGMALVCALQGQSEPLQQALADWRQLTSDDPAQQYRWVMRVLDGRMDLLSEQFRDGLRHATADPKSAATRSLWAKLESVATGMANLLEAMQPPKNHFGSHELRQLAHKLLIQAAGDCLAFAESGDEEAGSEATISLGEALKAFTPARELFENELSRR
jgi:tetratricopeptide (TPR) repeat protein